MVDIDRKTFGDGRAAVIIDQLKLLRIDSLLGVGEAALTAAEPLVKALQSPALQADPQAAAGLLAAAEVWLQGGDLARAADLSKQAFDLDTHCSASNTPTRPLPRPCWAVAFWRVAMSLQLGSGWSMR